ncbi:ERCC4 domain-containing protein [Gordonia bronchialis]|uniref:ERCC4 domain-containing protein n=1 Tax=Gordonia bronchialis TaxID=2054 RepID=UPI0024331B77|nr:histone-like nucleoid-structuring protein Lsr2 [Gordonia bronchialis]
MPDEFLIARNPEEGTTLPYLVRLPLGTDGIVLKVRETWPRTSKVYCHRVADWPEDAEIVERLPVRSISKRGAAIDLVLDRGRENRSQFVLTRARGREMIFWQSRRTAKQARPNVNTPKARAHGQVFEIAVDTRERYGYRFAEQQATTVKRALPSGDYAVFDEDELIAVAERKSIEDLAGTLLSGKLTYQLAELSTAPRAAVVVDSGYSRLFKLEHTPASSVADAVAEAQARFPSVPIVFCETRALAQEWLYRWFGACLHEAALSGTSDHAFAQDNETVPAPAKPPTPTSGQIREWARANGFQVSDRGRIPREVQSAFADAQR